MLTWNYKRTVLSFALASNLGCASDSNEAVEDAGTSSGGETSGSSAETTASPGSSTTEVTTANPESSTSSDGSSSAGDESSTSTSTGEAAFDVQLEETELGTVLVDGQGRTLYLFARDLPGVDDAAVSRCVDDCVGIWPLFQTEVSDVGPGLDAADFGTIVRDADGESQATYKGWPLYYFAQDQNPGDTLGEGVNQVWYVLPEPFYSVTTMNGGMEVGNYLADPSGASLYILTSDTPGDEPASACMGGCVDNWPLFAPDAFVVPSLLAAGDFSIFERADGAMQAAYRGMPLYFFAGDALPGDIAGDGLPGPMGNGEWLLLDPFQR